jgi:uncharacterized protein DUF1837
VALAVSDGQLKALRKGSRIVLKDDHDGYKLGKHIAGQLPYYYRTIEGIISDFASAVSALEAVVDLAANAPTSPHFRNSHCGEILASHFVESRLGFRRLYSKLTLTTSQNTNVHKMDGLFVNTAIQPFEYLFVEAKSSILPTEATKTKTHKSGILTQMIQSLDAYSADDPRFELTRIRDNLAKTFSTSEQSTIRADLVPPGPENLRVFGITVTNVQTVNANDDDFILTEPCSVAFDYSALVVTDLATLAADAYGYWDAMKKPPPDVQYRRAQWLY